MLKVDTEIPDLDDLLPNACELSDALEGIVDRAAERFRANVQERFGRVVERIPTESSRGVLTDAAHIQFVARSVPPSKVGSARAVAVEVDETQPTESGRSPDLVAGVFEFGSSVHGVPATPFFRDAEQDALEAAGDDLTEVDKQTG